MSGAYEGVSRPSRLQRPVIELSRMESSIVPTRRFDPLLVPRSADRAGPIKHGELPSGRQRIVPQDVAGAIVAAYLEVTMIRRQP